MNVTLKPQDLAISNGAASCLLSMWRVIDPVFIQPDLCKAAKYTVPLSRRCSEAVSSMA